MRLAQLFGFLLVRGIDPQLDEFTDSLAFAPGFGQGNGRVFTDRVAPVLFRRQPVPIAPELGAGRTHLKIKATAVLEYVWLLGRFGRAELGVSESRHTG